MALAEAIAHGLLVVSTMAGAIPDTVPAGTGLLVPSDDATALAQPLRRLISDRAERQRLAMKARAAGDDYLGSDGSACYCPSACCAGAR